MVCIFIQISYGFVDHLRIVVLVAMFFIVDMKLVFTVGLVLMA